MSEPLRTTEAAAAAVALVKAMRPRPVPGDRVVFDLDRTGFPIDVRIERRLSCGTPSLEQELVEANDRIACVRCGLSGPFNSRGWCQDCASPPYS